MLILVQYTFLIDTCMLLFGYFSAGVKYLQEPYIWADGDCVSTFWWRHIRWITGIATLLVTFSLGYCLCLLLSILIRPPFVRKRKEQRTKWNEKNCLILMSLSFIVFWFCMILPFSALGFFVITSSHWERPVFGFLGFRMYSILF